MLCRRRTCYMCHMVPMSLPVVACDDCPRNYTLDEWRGLEPAEPDREPARRLAGKGWEIRACVCGRVLALDAAYVGELELVVDASKHLRAFPHSERPKTAILEDIIRAQDSARRRKIVGAAIAAATALVVVLSALAVFQP